MNKKGMVEQIKITTVNDGNRNAFYSLVEEYLPDSEPERLMKYEKEFPKAFLTLLDGNEVIGVAFGWLRSIEVPEDDSFELNGMAVRYDYQKRTYGKKLLAAFEQAAMMYGASAVSVGSAGGYVEKFYIDCGYYPTEYKVWNDNGPSIEKTFADLEDYYSYERQSEDGFVVMYKCFRLIGETK